MEEYDEFVIRAMDEGWIEPVFDDDEVRMRVVPGDDNPIWEVHMQSVDEDISKLIEMGMAEVAGLDENGAFVYKITEYGEKFMK